MPVDITSLILRALGFIALFQAAGMVLFLGLLSDAMEPGYRQAELRIRGVAQRCAWLGIALLIGYELLGGARMTGEFSGLLDRNMQFSALKASGGVAVVVRTAGLILIAFAAKQSGIRWNTVATTGVSLVVVSFVITGHISTHSQRWLMAPLLLLHLWVMAFWFGSLWPLHVLTKIDPAQARAVIGQFSRIAVLLVPCIAIAGVTMALLLLPSIEVLWQPYGLLLISKAIGFALLMGLATLNKWRWGPAMEAGSKSAVVSFQRTVLIEYALICVILILTAVMTGWFSPE